jgi:hypothetical protein
VWVGQGPNVEGSCGPGLGPLQSHGICRPSRTHRHRRMHLGGLALRGGTNENMRRAHELNALEIIAAELERLLVLKEHELGVTLEHEPDSGFPYVPTAEN